MKKHVIAKAVLAHPALHDIIVHKLFTAISDECAVLCRPTRFRNTPVEELQDFKWSMYTHEMETKSPLLLKLMRKIVSHSNTRNNAKQGMHLHGHSCSPKGTQQRDSWLTNIPYRCERGPMGGAPYIGLKLGGGPTFVASLSRFNAKERPGKLPT